MGIKPYGPPELADEFICFHVTLITTYRLSDFSASKNSTVDFEGLNIITPAKPFLRIKSRCAEMRRSERYREVSHVSGARKIKRDVRLHAVNNFRFTD